MSRDPWSMQSPRLVRRHWTLAAVLVLGMVATATGPAAAEPSGTGGAAAGGDGRATAGVQVAGAPGANTTKVLLLTGDRVIYTEHPDGRTSVAVAAADRPDGRAVPFEMVESSDGHYVIPADAFPLLADGTLDPQLFNVTTLVDDGLADAHQLPVIVTTGTGTLRTGAMPATGQATTLSSIGGAGLRLDHDDAVTLWDELTAAGQQPATGQRLRAASGASRIWLDRAVEVSLDESVPQIGAPQVWDAGHDGSGVSVAVLDTGVDPDHPDLADRVVDTANFTPDPFVDGHGHGTHVASTVAGSGEASGGAYRGVAPGADLLVGKVIPDSGTGSMSAVIDGMEWAAHAGADIVNLSIGSVPTDGTDPASLALEALTEQTGALFVVAAGNNSGDASVTSPAAATSALAVGAVDKQDQLAPYSNRGPRHGDAAVKPELTAPGTGIAAARAAGTSLGQPLDEHYTRSSGTSMATPHVAGAAALLAQANPDWSWRELKDALVSTAEPGDYATFQGGAGRLDVARAVDAGVYGPASVNLGAFPAPYDQQETAELTYRNHTDQPVTLNLELAGHSWHNQPLPAGAVELDDTTMTVPAGDTATVSMAVDAAPGDVGAYTGVVTASSGSLTLRTPFGYYKSVGSNELTVRAVDFRGEPQSGQPLRAVKLDGALPNDPFFRAETWDWSDDNGEVRLQVADGLYDVYANLANSWDLYTNRLTSVVETELEITSDTSVTLDGAEAILVDPDWPERTDLKASSASYRRGFVDGEFGTGWGNQYSPTKLYMQPAEFGTGWLEVTENWQVASSLISTAEVRGGNQTLPITPQYHSFYAAPGLDGEHDLELVSAGTGSPEEFAQADLAGKVGLVRVPVPQDPQPNPPSYVFAAFNDITDDAIAAGAAGLVFYVDEPGARGIPGAGPRSEEILQLSIPYDQGVELRTLVEGVQDQPARLVLEATRDPERIYRLREWHEDPSLPEPRRQVDVDELVAVENRYHADGPDYTQRMFSSAFTPREQVVAGLTPKYWAPLEATEYILPGEHLRWHRQAEQLGPEPGTAAASPLQTREMFLPGDERDTEVWFQSPMGTGAADVPPDTQWAPVMCSFCRQGDLFRPGSFYLDSDTRHYDRTLFLEGTSYRMFRDGEEIPNSGSAFFPRFPMDSEPATYRLEMEGVQPGVPQVRTLAPRTDTTWTFGSERPKRDGAPEGYSCPFSDEQGCAFQPLLQLDWQLDLDLRNRAPADGRHTFQVAVAPHSGTEPELVRTVPRPWFDVWFSTDEGDSWQAASVEPGSGRNAFTVTVEHPPLAETGGFVWLRAEARDTAGNRVEQTIERAYALR